MKEKCEAFRHKTQRKAGQTCYDKSTKNENKNDEKPYPGG